MVQFKHLQARRFHWLAIGLVVVGAASSTTFAQMGENEAEVNDSSAPAIDASEESRDKVEILESDRWRRMQRQLNEWLSVQTLYDDDEVAALRGSLRGSVKKMSANEVEDFLEDMEDRLAVLTSPEAEDARLWLSKFMATARNPEQQLGRNRPDVMNMTASQIRQELRWLQQTREQRARAQASFQSTRAAQSQVARNARTARQESRAAVSNRANWPANNPRRPSLDAPQPELRPQPLSPYIVSPWGHPIYRHPLRDQW
jgi:hypothetical protein